MVEVARHGLLQQRASPCELAGISWETFELAKGGDGVGIDRERKSQGGLAIGAHGGGDLIVGGFLGGDEQAQPG